LRAKTLFIISVTLVGLIIIIYAISAAVLTSGFAQVEERESRQNVQRALDALANNLAELSRVTRDYASWG
jgi:sensor domain CHASE-containing protein